MGATKFAVSSENIGEDDQIPYFSNVCITCPEDVTEFSTFSLLPWVNCLCLKAHSASRNPIVCKNYHDHNHEITFLLLEVINTYCNDEIGDL